MKLLHYQLEMLAEAGDFSAMVDALADELCLPRPRFVCVHAPNPYEDWREISIYEPQLKSAEPAKLGSSRLGAYYRRSKQMQILATFYPRDCADIY